LGDADVLVLRIVEFEFTTNLIAAPACQMRLVAIISSKMRLKNRQVSAKIQT
jgi:hypothetical protein